MIESPMIESTMMESVTIESPMPKDYHIVSHHSYVGKFFVIMKYIAFCGLFIWWACGLSFVHYIYDRYPIMEPWVAAFPNLDKNAYNRACIQIHLIGGVLIQILGPFQLIPSLRTWGVHKWVGRIYLLSMIAAVIGGEMFMFVNPTIGGSNMTISFAVYGIAFFICGGMAFYYARLKQYRTHMYWALVTFCLGIAPWCYRLLYFISCIFGYDVHSITQDFQRPLDMAFSWLFFVPNIIITSFIIFILHKTQPKL